MVNQILAIARKDLLVILKDRSSWVSLLLVPVLFAVVLSYAMQGNFSAGAESEPIHLPVVNQDSGKLGAAIITALKEMDGLAIEEQASAAAARQLVAARERRLAVIIPPDFSQQVQADQKFTIEIVADPGESEQFTLPLLGLLQGVVERQIAIARFGPVAAVESSGGLELVRTAPPGVEPPKQITSAQLYVPGWTIFGVFSILSIIAGALLDEREQGTFRRLIAAPMGRGAVLLGKLLPFLLINVMQIVLMLVAGSLWFKFSLGNSLWGLALVTLATAAAGTSLGLMAAALVKTRAQANGLIVPILGASAFAGLMIPHSALPGWMQQIGLLTPQFWAHQGLLDLIVRGVGAVEIMPKVLNLLAFAAVFFGVAVSRFRFDEDTRPSQFPLAVVIAAAALLIVGARNLDRTLHPPVVEEHVAAMATPLPAPTVAAPTEYTRSELAQEASALFWKALQTNPSLRDQAIDLLSAAALTDPQDGVIWFHLGMAQLWRGVESENVSPAGRAALALQTSAVAEHALARAMMLLPNDRRIPGFHSTAALALAAMTGDQAAIQQAYAEMLQAVRDYPEFNAFNPPIIFAMEDPDDPRFKAALEEATAVLNKECNDPVACANTDKAPHNLEGTYFLVGDLYARAGDKENALAYYTQALQFPDAEIWAYRAMLEQRLSDLDATIAAFRASDPAEQLPVITSSNVGCRVCHAASINK